jgi:ABC-type Co2+ transport system permease subunit
VFWRGAIATVAALLLASLLLIAIVGASHAEVQAFLHDPAEHGEGGPGPAGASGASLSTFAVMVLSFGAVGWIIEGAITGAVIRFISRVKPDLLAHVLHAGKAGGAS